LRVGGALSSGFAKSAQNLDPPRPPQRWLRVAVEAEMPRSGKPAELLAAAGIDAEHIADAARRLVRERATA
jgi:hypothetical protein